MKKNIKTAWIWIIAMLFISTAAFSQNIKPQKPDRIFFLDGSVKEGKVKSLAEQKIQFVYSGETLNYDFDKKGIEKIEFASGRTELLNKKAEEQITRPVIAKNKVAVIPMVYIGEGNSDKMEDMRFRLQEITVNYLSKSAAELKFLDPAEINAILLKRGINEETIREYTPKEIAEILHVEYVIMGTVLQNLGSVQTVGNSYDTKKQRTDRDRRDTKVITRRHSVEVAHTRQNIETEVSLNIYNESGEKIYTKSRKSILSNQDAYKNAMEYLLKRTPLYNR